MRWCNRWKSLRSRSWWPWRINLPTNKNYRTKNNYLKSLTICLLFIIYFRIRPWLLIFLHPVSIKLQLFFISSFKFLLLVRGNCHQLPGWEDAYNEINKIILKLGIIRKGWSIYFITSFHTLQTIFFNYYLIPFLIISSTCGTTWLLLFIHGEMVLCFERILDYFLYYFFLFQFSK